MTRAETTEIFAAFMLAYPHAEMFKAPSRQALMDKLAPVITLWAACLKDVDFWTGQQAAARAIRAHKFPPTIAEFREQAERVRREAEDEARAAYLTARSMIFALPYATADEVLAHMPARAKKTIDAMGGLGAFCPPDCDMLDMEGFVATYGRLLRRNPVGLPGGGKLGLNCEGGERG